jgi:hypothetical protein
VENETRFDYSGRTDAWRHNGGCVVLLSSLGETSGEAETLLAKARSGITRMGAELRIDGQGGCQNSVNGITLFFSAAATDCCYLRGELIDRITYEDGRSLWINQGDAGA